MNRPPLDRQTRRLVRLLVPIVRSAARDDRTRQTAYEAASTLTGRHARDVIGRLGEFSQPVTQWLDVVRRSERRRRLRTVSSRVGIIAASGGLLASWLLTRPRRQHGHDDQTANRADARSGASSEAATTLP